MPKGILSKFIWTLRHEGVGSALRKSANYLRAGAPQVLSPKRDVIGYFNTILGEERGYGLKLTSENVPKGSMSWLIPDFNANSGGHINILRMMRLLKERGFPEQHVVVMEPHRWASAQEAEKALVDAFGDHGITISLGVDSLEPSEYVVATGWQTAYWVAKYRDAIHKLYFVQDFEPDFYARGSEYSLAENTYRLGLTAITAGSWLSDKLNNEYGMTAFPYDFSYDADLYKQTQRRPSPTRHIFFYARPVTVRRCFELGLLALDAVCKQHDDVAVIFAGWDVSGYEIPFPHLNAGSVSIRELPDLYSQCDVAVVLSSTNLSLLPLELAACGCPLVMNEGANSKWLLEDDEATYCKLDVDDLSRAINEVLDQPVDAKKKAKKALARAHSSSWGKEADKVAKFLANL